MAETTHTLLENVLEHPDEPGLYTMDVKGPTATSLAKGLAAILRDYEALDYVELRLADENDEEYSVLVQRRAGRTPAELNHEIRSLLTDILPLAMGASCLYDDHPDASRTVHCCDWSPIVQRICEALGLEQPEDDAERCERVRQEGGELWRAYWRPESEVDLTKLGPREFVVAGGERGGHYLFAPVSKEGEA